MKQVIFVTGGHITPALAVIDVLRKKHESWEMVFIGRKYAKEGDLQYSSEYIQILERNIPFLSMHAGRVTRVFSLWSLYSILKIPFGFMQALFYLLVYRPSLILSFGGYIALPVVLVGKCLGIRIVTHEQTHKLGLANSIIANVAQAVCLSHKPSDSQLLSNKYVYTGLPIRQEFFQTAKKPEFLIGSPKKLLYVTGGTTGAYTLNQCIFPILSKLISEFTVVHQTGHDSFELAVNAKNSLPKTMQDRYVIAQNFNVADVVWLLQNATLVISRSGANTVSEIAACSAVALLVPLPWSARSEQFDNANDLVKVGSAKVLDQSHITANRLYDTICEMTKQIQVYKKNAQAYRRDELIEAASRVVDVVERVMDLS